MKSFAIAALIAVTSAKLGEDCYYDETVCDSDGLACAKWNDSQYGEMASCEDCSQGNQEITDSYGDPVEYQCPVTETAEDAPAEDTSSSTKPTTKPTAPGPAGGEDGSMYITLSAASVIAAASIMA